MKRKRSSTSTAKLDDPYLAIVHEQWGNILRWYQMFATKKPVMLFDIQEQRIYAYPYKEFKDDLSEPSQKLLAEQYQNAIANNRMVVFVRDNEKRKLVSFAMDID